MRAVRFDPRLIVGVVLVLGSVAGVYAIVATADRTTEVYVARGPLLVGQSIDRGDLVATSVRLGQETERYLGVNDVPDDGLVMARSVLAGELVPASAVSTTDESGLAAVVVTVRGRLPERIETGSVVDLWSARAIDQGEFDAPAVLVADATVARVTESDGLIASDRGQSVEVLVPRNAIASVLEAIADDDAISIVLSGR